MFFNIFIKSKRFIIFLLSTIILSLSIIIMLVIINKKSGNKNVDVTNLENLFGNYYAVYDMTVISNKNINTYSVKEWHENGMKTKFEYLDYMKNVITIEVDNENCYITNNNNKAKILVQNLYNNKNIMSISTFMYIYKLINGNCGCNKNVYEKEQELIVELTLAQNGSCEASNLGRELGISKLELVIIDGKPVNYIVYDENKKEYISIVYNIFENNLNK